MKYEQKLFLRLENPVSDGEWFMISLTTEVPYNIHTAIWAAEHRGELVVFRFRSWMQALYVQIKHNHIGQKC